jgi:flavin-dependent dehydrogenase
MSAPAHYDVAVIGAGPAGCAAAAALAAGGARVALADRAEYPRDKTCGDGLLPDAQRALAELGVLEAVAAAGATAPTLAMRTASGLHARFPVPSVVTRRRDVDRILLERAVAAGAVFLPGHALERVARVHDHVATMHLASATGPAELAAGTFLLATGAARRPRELAGLGGGGVSAAALRGYATVGGLPGDELLIALLGELPRGYAWAFPGPEGAWNVGCGVFAGVRQARSLGKVLERFLASIGGAWREPPQGASLVTSFPALAFARGNLGAIGEAAGLTRPFSGEGIGPALESGLLAARCLLAEPGEGGIAAYARELRRRYAGDLRAWRFGEQFLRVPRLVDAIVRRANRFPGALRRCAAVLGGTMSASRVLSPWGLLRLIAGR